MGLLSSFVFATQLKMFRKHMNNLEQFLSPDELIALIEPYIHAAQGRMIQAEYDQGTYGTKVKRHEGESYD